jgi:hypothetical protein
MKEAILTRLPAEIQRKKDELTRLENELYGADSPLPPHYLEARENMTPGVIVEQH